MKKLVLVTGANGFTGRYVCEMLLKKNIPFVVILRPETDPTWMNKNKIEVRYADLFDHRNLTKAFKGGFYLLNVASIGFGSIHSILLACKKAGIERAIFVSTTAIFTNLNAKSKKKRIEAEDAIINSGINWTILRPTMIMGTPEDRNMIKLIKWIEKFKIVPIFGSGYSLQQPVYVKDIAWSIVKIINDEQTFFKAFNLSGKTALNFREIIKVVSKELKQRPIFICLPKNIIINFLKVFEYFRIVLPIKAEQVMRLNEDKNFSFKKAKKTFKYNPKSFKKAIRSEINLYKKSRNTF